MFDGSFLSLPSPPTLTPRANCLCSCGLRKRLHLDHSTAIINARAISNIKYYDLLVQESREIEEHSSLLPDLCLLWLL